MRELEQYQKTEAYKVFSRKAQDRQKGKSHRQGIDQDKNVCLARREDSQLDTQPDICLKLVADKVFFLWHWPLSTMSEVIRFMQN